MKTSFLKTPVGYIQIRADEAAIHEIRFVNKPGKNDQSRLLAEAAKQLSTYVEGRAQSFDLPLTKQGTAFQRRVWAAARKIPSGKTVSYAELARKIRKPNAYRAVANALGENPYCIVVPCHRVVQTSGKLGGYNGGVHRKKWLLTLEQD